MKDVFIKVIAIIGTIIVLIAMLAISLIAGGVSVNMLTGGLGLNYSLMDCIRIFTGMTFTAAWFKLLLSGYKK